MMGIRPGLSRILADRRVMLVAKSTLAVLLLWAVLRRCDAAELGEALHGVKPGLIAVALFLHIPGYVVSSWRWKLLLRGQGADVPVSRLFRLYLVGTFFNNFLPTTIGGDVMRVMGTAPYCSSKSVAGTVVLVERMTGLFAMAMLALGAVVCGAAIPPGCGVGWILAGVFVFFAAACISIGSVRMRAVLTKLVGRVAPPRVAEKLLVVGRAFSAYGNDRRPILLSVALSFVLQTNVILYYLLIARALGVEVRALEFFFILPAAQLVMMIPVTPNAVGIRENVFAFFLGGFGVAPEVAVAVAWIAFAFVLVYAVAGGIVYAIRR